MSETFEVLAAEAPSLLDMDFTSCLRISDQISSSKDSGKESLQVNIISDININNLSAVLKAFIFAKGIYPQITFIKIESIDQLGAIDVDLIASADATIIFLSPMRLANWLIQPEFFTLDNQARGNYIERDINILLSNLSALSEKVEHLILVNNMPFPRYPYFGHQDWCFAESQLDYIYQFNKVLASYCRNLSNIFLTDVARIINPWIDKLWWPSATWKPQEIVLYYNILRNLGLSYISYLYPLKRVPKKCIVLDLDNTLWGGVLGEVGSSIHLGPDLEGSPFFNFQQQLFGLSRRGILLAIASKNDADEALSLIDYHPYMVLKDTFVAMKINWELKSRSIEQIAKELNIGLDSIVFLDDSAFEREIVRNSLPEVLVPDLPKEPGLYCDLLETLVELQPLQITNEALTRTRSYQIKSKRSSLKADFSIHEMNKQLHTQVAIQTAQSDSISRIAELCLRTNQFNLTTRRYGTHEIQNFVEDSQHTVLAVRVSDDYEDFGIVGVVILAEIENTWIIDTLLLSCRVLSREIELAILYIISEMARRNGLEKLIGEFIPTERNQSLVSRFYGDHHFQFLLETTDGIRKWEYLVSEEALAAPKGINIVL